MGKFMAAIAERDRIAALARRFVIVTATQTGEVRGMRWREVDSGREGLDRTGRANEGEKTHRAPLSPAAQAVLDAVRPLANGPGDLVFLGGRTDRSPTRASLSPCASHHR
jgi:integrase